MMKGKAEGIVLLRARREVRRMRVPPNVLFVESINPQTRRIESYGRTRLRRDGRTVFRWDGMAGRQTRLARIGH